MQTPSTAPCVLLAGRRPDSDDAEVERFPIENVVLVRERIRALFAERRPGHLVCSAACGADLLALDVAGDLGVRRHVVLPFEQAAFRASSVTDRPGSWGTLFDRVVREVAEAGGLTVLDEESGDEAAYEAASDRLLEEALGLNVDVLAVAVWEGASRGEGDLTEALLGSASRAGARTTELLTR